MNQTNRAVDPQRIIVVANPIQAALFNSVIAPELERDDGKWGSKHQENLRSDWVGATAVVAEPGQPLGRNFVAQKTNWNANDSSWVNQKPVESKMIEIASAAAGRPVLKREIIENLTQLKDVFKQHAEVSGEEELAA